MFLTTEQTISRPYTVLKVIHAVSYGYAGTAGFRPKDPAKQADELVEQALGKLAYLASTIGADGVISLQHSTTMYLDNFYVTIVGTAIKF
jgi:uncharacterized protein YbjQ (UPF0145 family)